MLPSLESEFLVMANPEKPLASNHLKNSDLRWQAVSNTSAIQTAFIVNIISTAAAATTTTKITATSNLAQMLGWLVQFSPHPSDSATLPYHHFLSHALSPSLQSLSIYQIPSYIPRMDFLILFFTTQ